MKFFRITYLLGCFCLTVSPAFGQVVNPEADTTAGDTLQSVVPPDTSLAADTTAADSLKPEFKVIPWKFNTSVDMELVSTDSTLRWEIWPNWLHKKNGDPGVITYRMGTIARTNAMAIFAHGPRYQQLRWEDVNMNDPVSGTVNWDVIPLHKINSFYESNEGINHTSSYFLQQYYVNKPLSQLYYEESKFDTRSLEFMVSQNLNARTNAEISYWDRRDGGEYPNTGVNGRQIFSRVFYQLNKQQALKLHYLNNNYDIGEPFGYGITDLTRFPFNRYQVNARQNTAQSHFSRSNLALNFYHRQADSTRAAAGNFRAGLFFNSAKRSLTYNIDSTYYKVESIGANAHKWFDIGPLQLEGLISDEWFFNRDRNQSALDFGNWNLLRGEATIKLIPLPFWAISGSAGGRYRSDGFNAYTAEVSSDILIQNHLHLSASVAQGTIMPTPQQLYWSSREYRGNSTLDNTHITSIWAEASFSPIRNLNVGIQSQVKNIRQGIMINGDSTFAHVDPYGTIAGSAYFKYDSKYFEMNGSATYQRFGHFLHSPGTPLPMQESERVWLKGGVYVKGYLFDRATFVKFGLSGMMAPLTYQAAHYNPVLDYWQPVSDDQFLPAFNRLDVDISARIRSIMITLRWENVLDDVSQLGYFETAQYPMGQRRLLFGVRALFRN